ncbi:hypothetical protein Tco_1077171 [Tanacetum coccineum]
MTTTTVTPTPTTATIITNHNRTKGKKLSEPMLETSHCVEDVFYITQDLALLLVMPVERNDIIQISTKRPPTTMPRGELTC